MQLNALPQLLVDRLHQLHAALHPQRVGEGGLKGLSLLRGGQGRLRAKYSVDELLVEKLRLAHVVQGVIQVGRPPVKGGEQKTKLRRGHYLAASRPAVFTCRAFSAGT